MSSDIRGAAFDLTENATNQGCLDAKYGWHLLSKIYHFCVVLLETEMTSHTAIKVVKIIIYIFEEA